MLVAAFLTSDPAPKVSDLPTSPLPFSLSAVLSLALSPQPNYAKMAELCEYKTANSAAVMFGNLKRKLVAKYDVEGNTLGTPKAGSGGRKKRSISAAGDGNDVTPSKAARKPKAAAVESAGGKNLDHEDDDEEIVVAKKMKVVKDEITRIPGLFHVADTHLGDEKAADQ